MTREEYLNRLRIVADVPRDDLFTVHAQKLADDDADRRVRLAEKNALIEQQATEIAKMQAALKSLKEAHP